MLSSTLVPVKTLPVLARRELSVARPSMSHLSDESTRLFLCLPPAYVFQSCYYYFLSLNITSTCRRVNLLSATSSPLPNALLMSSSTLPRAHRTRTLSRKRTSSSVSPSPTGKGISPPRLYDRSDPTLESRVCRIRYSAWRRRQERTRLLPSHYGCFYLSFCICYIHCRLVY